MLLINKILSLAVGVAFFSGLISYVAERVWQSSNQKLREQNAQNKINEIGDIDVSGGSL